MISLLRFSSPDESVPWVWFNSFLRLPLLDYISESYTFYQLSISFHRMTIYLEFRSLKIREKLDFFDFHFQSIVSPFIFSLYFSISPPKNFYCLLIFQNILFSVTFFKIRDFSSQFFKNTQIFKMSTGSASATAAGEHNGQPQNSFQPSW